MRERTPVVIIKTGDSVRDAYEDARYRLNQQFHNYSPRFQEGPISEQQYGELETGAAYASHAADGLTTNGNYVSMDGGSTWVHIEKASA